SGESHISKVHPLPAWSASSRTELFPVETGDMTMAAGSAGFAYGTRRPVLSRGHRKPDPADVFRDSSFKIVPSAAVVANGLVCPSVRLYKNSSESLIRVANAGSSAERAEPPATTVIMT